MRSAQLLENACIVLIVLGSLLFMLGFMGFFGHYGFRANRPGDWLVFGTLPLAIIGLAMTGLWKKQFTSEEFKQRISSTMEFAMLLEKLSIAMVIVEVTATGKSFRFVSHDGFLEKLNAAFVKLKDRDLHEIENLWRWFSPGNEWDTFTGMEGAEIGAEVFQLVEKIRNDIG